MTKENFSEGNLKLLVKLSDKLASSSGFAEELPNIFASAEKILGADSGIMILNRSIPALPKIYFHGSRNPLNSIQLNSIAAELNFKKPFYDNDYSNSRRRLKILIDNGVKSVITCPLMFQNIFGSLVFLSHKENNCFNTNNLFLLKLFSRVLSAAIKYNHISHRFRLARKAIDAVLQVNPVLDASLDLQSILDSLLTSALELAPASLAHIFLYDNKKLRFGAALGPDGKWDKPFSEPRKNGLTYAVARSGKTQIITDIQNDPIFRDKKKKWDGSIVSIPLKIRERVVGVMNISEFRPGQFTRDSLRIWKLFSNQAAIAIENARLFAEERKLRLRNEALRSAATVITRSLNLSEVLNRILTEIRRVVPYDSASIMIKEGDQVKVVAGKDLPDNNAIGKYYRGNRLAKKMEETGKPLILKDARSSKEFTGWGNTGYVRGWLGVPLITRDKMIGYITLDSREKSAYTKADGDIAFNFAYQAAIAVENATLHESLKEKLKALENSQNQLIQSEKLAAVGRLVAGIAHELNNPLTSIVGIAQLLKTAEKNNENAEYLDRLVSEANRTADIVRGLLDFTHQRQSQYTEININDVITETIKLISYDVKSHNIDITTNLSPDMPATTADFHKLQQVFINLIINAIQAISESGKGDTVAITTNRIEQSEPAEHPGKDLPGHTFTSGRVIRIIITDNGPGIPDNIISSIFDPFFTTKPIGSGTGLGLSVCHGIIREHRGSIRTQSTPGKGAEFIIDLPVIPLPEYSPQKIREPAVYSSFISAPEPTLTEKEHTIRILVAEDEDTLRRIMVRYLKKCGYHADSAKNGIEAFDCIRKEQYTLIISDIKMPGINGIELYKKVLKVSPRLAGHFIISTGDIISRDSAVFLSETNIPCLTKPFEMKTMENAVREILKIKKRIN